jgi:hypothetical protein
MRMLLNRPGKYSRKPVGRVGQFRGMGQLHNQRLQCRSGVRRGFGDPRPTRTHWRSLSAVTSKVQRGLGSGPTYKGAGRQVLCMAQSVGIFTSLTAGIEMDCAD